MRRLALTLALALVLPAALQARPAKRRPARKPAAAGALASPTDDASSIQATPDDLPARQDEPAPAAPAAETPPARAPAPKPPEVATPATDAASAPGPSIDLQKLRADYDRLRDELFRARARAQVVQEGLYGARLAAELRWKAAPDAVIRHAEIRLDGATIWDSGDKPVTDDKLTVAERPCKPGPHALTLRLEVRPGTKKKGKDIDGLGYSSEQTFAIDVPDGKRTTIALTGDEDGSLPNYEPRIELELESETLKK
ncbi:MAG TPA: hypothetical protein VG319_12730 [Polyangia bacterium]|jgi:hypothetical protein|nr:hypothetical protein [Polyangia bacterium]